MPQSPSYNNPYLVDLLEVLIRKKLGFPDDLKIASVPLFRSIANQLDEENPPSVEQVKNFFEYLPDGIPLKYFAAPKTLNRWSKFVSGSDWKSFSKKYRLAAGYLDILIETRGRAKEEIYKDYHDKYKDLKNDISNEISKTLSNQFFPTDVDIEADEIKNFYGRTIPEPPPMFGNERWRALGELSSHLVNNEKPLVIIGDTGSGKSNLAFNLISSQIVEDVFGENRYIVRCDNLSNYTAFINEIAASLGVHFSDFQLDHKIISQLNKLGKRSLILFDNFEVVYELEDDHMRNFMDRLKKVVTLCFTLRATALPADLAWKDYTIPDLVESEAIALFDFHTDSRFENMKLKNFIIYEVDLVPLCIELFAKRAKSVVNLTDLCEEWSFRKTKLLALPGKKNDRNSNLELSLSLSFASPRLIDDDRALLAEMSHFPGRIQRSLLRLVSKNSFDSIERLKTVGLLREGTVSDIWILKPVVEYLMTVNVGNESYKDALLRHHINIAYEVDTGSDNINFKKNAIQVSWSNIIYSCNALLHEPSSIYALVKCAGIAVTNFQSYEFLDILKRGLDLCLNRVDLFNSAACYRSIGEVLTMVGESKEAEIQLSNALHIYCQIEDDRGKAISFQLRAKIRKLLDNYTGAEDDILQALRFFRKKKARYSTGVCLRILGDIAGIRGNWIKSRKHYNSAIKSISGEKGLTLANVLLSIADLDYKENNLSDADERCIQALSLFEEMDEPFGYSNALILRSLIASRNGLWELALEYLDEADAAFDEMESKTGKGNALVIRGRIYWNNGWHKESIKVFQEVLDLRNCDEVIKIESLINLGRFSQITDMIQAQAYLEEAMHMADNTSAKLIQAECKYELSAIAWVQRNASLARKNIEQAMKFYLDQEILLKVGECLRISSQIYEIDEDYTNAYRELIKARRIFNNLKHQENEAVTLLSLAIYNIGGDKLKLARKQLLEALQKSQEPGTKSRRGIMHMNLGRIELKEGYDNLAKTAYLTALSLLEDSRATLTQGSAHCDLGNLLASSSPAESEYHYEQAKQIWKSIGATNAIVQFLPSQYSEDI